MRSRSLGLFCSLILVACGETRGLGVPAGPLVTIQGRIDGALPSSAGRLHVGILWAAPPVFIPYCHQYGPTPLDPDRDVTPVARLGCRDPFEVVPDRMGPTMALEAGATTFELPIHDLPPPEVMVGPIESRVAYGSLVVFADGNDDRELRLIGGCTLPFQGRPEDPPIRRPREPILASTFTTLAKDQLRIVYTEGTFDEGSYFYPHPSCSDLPSPGFSQWKVGSYLDRDSGVCVTLPIETEIVLHSEPAEQLDNLACRQSERRSFTRPPRVRIEDVAFECTQDGELAAVVADCECPDVRVLSLKGCFDDAGCTNPDWDLTEDVPDWWPCGDPRRP